VQGLPKDHWTYLEALLVLGVLRVEKVPHALIVNLHHRRLDLERHVIVCIRLKGAYDFESFQQGKTVKWPNALQHRAEDRTSA